MILSHDVSKIMTACRMLQISKAQRQMKAKIHSFPTMYILGGVDVVEIGQIKVFVQELGLTLRRIAYIVSYQFLVFLRPMHWTTSVWSDDTSSIL